MKHGKYLLWFVFIGLALTGIGLDLTLPATSDDFPHPWHGDMRVAHGLFVFLGLMSFGQVYQEHIRKQFKKWRQYPDGFVHLSVWLLTIVTGFLVYYPPMWLSEWLDIARIHWYLSLVMILVLPAHVLLHRPKRSKKLAKTTLASKEITPN